MGTVHLKPGYTFYDYQNDREITITGRHFSDYAVNITEYVGDEENQDAFKTYETIFTAAEIRIALHAKYLIWEG